MKIQDETVRHTNKWWFAGYIGFFAGVIWGALKIIEHFFRFTELTPGFLVEPFFRHSFLMTWQGYLVGWVFYILFSVAASLIYGIFLAKVKGPWGGVAYGVCWWGLLYLLVGPALGMMPWLGQIEWNTLITDACLFVLWGLFIGYSISVEFTDERTREPFKKGA
ncbi:YqhR family membrane protein [Paenibacillus hamazuiensis]|uniref:YqhR family membrane protein n=1 Tax=Paenibacillus hamazuiensis TaxID=2936508 RepID=UPI00200BF07C|nr:YqhR family membrane protein [Paenibacillus hamazuiensis]